ncbi:methylmalonic aciduria and homocystinuria type D protein [Coemansia mojavensis]|nr:methylmalonic aciduria and homocystinuria type D protein [Coemansia mojavensis]
MQYSVHACPRQMKREVGLVFPDVVGKESDLLIIPTFQKTTTSMISYEPETQEEKDVKLHQFYRWGSDFVSRIREQGYWADITDPMSGMALFTNSGPSLYPDVESAEILLRYTPFNLGMCFVLSHPQWGTHVYPATAFTLAPVAVVQQVLYAMSLT